MVRVIEVITVSRFSGLVWLVKLVVGRVSRIGTISILGRISRNLDICVCNGILYSALFCTATFTLTLPKKKHRQSSVGYSFTLLKPRKSPNSPQIPHISLTT